MTDTTAGKLKELREKLEAAKEPGGERAVAKRAAKGIASPRERLDMLFDPGTFVEFGRLAKMPGAADSGYGDGVVTGHGLVNGRPVAAFSHDQTVFGGTVGEMFGRKVSAIMEWAGKIGCPMVGINDSAGARIQDAVTSLAWYAEMGRRNDLLSGLAPQVSIILGKCAGGAVYTPANTDILVGVKDESYMFVTGPDILREVNGEDVSAEELGGSYNQSKWGNIHHLADDEKSAFEWVRDYLEYMPSSCHEKAPVINPGLEPEITPSDLSLDTFMPNNDNTGYDMRDIILRVFDDGAFHEVAELFAPNIITGYARVDGISVGVVANQPNVMAGVLDTDSSEKATRFVRICNAYNIPLIFLVDTPGILPGVEEEKKGTIRRSGKFLFAYVEADVPKITVVLRKAYGGAYAVMGCKQLGADINFAWPTAKIAVMGAESAATILTRRQTENATPEEAAKIRQDFVDFYNTMMATPYLAAERGYIDAVIDPSSTRLQLRKALAQLKDKHILRSPRKHFLMPI
ncbi:acyl-CoA carboxylase subunit beta [Williamsia muralis]|uniref:Methylmalonyl-CoA carboxyltransferase n=1 Tax=Williamsia marianensis TaxID=85044 RepID=A0A2G3PML5_WILMA|nr:acyl-CoA carboxylase subunit beta [Williamsia marianensis]PHV67010.1 methylmalonyl-CoA carboxyltransferase [Williamsia marianensis]PZU04243.1 MAG: acyl-CoA carboxylase subunit beta [Gordonia sp. (in: high G+C Gram-positive bacteria)]